MAVTGTDVKKKYDELEQDGVQAQQQAQQPAQQQAQPQQQTQQGYTGLEGVSSRTSQQAGNYQNGYQQSDAVAQAQQRLADIQGMKPQSYSSKYGAQLDNILQQIQHPEEFKYTFDGDELFKMYADQYTQRGRQASMDAMGQAAALTGGYGNSYGAMVGNQAYQQYLLGLYDKGLELRDRAYQQYQDKLGRDRDMYNILAAQDQQDYARYRDTMGDWEREREYLTNRADTERQLDYNDYMANRDYWTGLAQVENQDYRSEQQRQEAIRQYEQNYAESVREFDEQMRYQREKEDKQYAYNYGMSIINNGKIPSKELLMAMGLSEPDAKKMIRQMEENVAAGGGGGGGGSSARGKNKSILKNAWEEIAYQVGYYSGYDKAHGTNITQKEKKK